MMKLSKAVFFLFTLICIHTKSFACPIQIGNYTCYTESGDSERFSSSNDFYLFKKSHFLVVRERLDASSCKIINFNVSELGEIERIFEYANIEFNTDVGGNITQIISYSDTSKDEQYICLKNQESEEVFEKALLDESFTDDRDKKRNRLMFDVEGDAFIDSGTEFIDFNEEAEKSRVFSAEFFCNGDVDYSEFDSLMAKPHLCVEPGCGKSFAQLSNLNTHKLTHTGERPCLCTEPGCGMRFTTLSNLARHKFWHTGKRPYSCTFPGCSSAFAQSCNLTTHLRKHTGDRPYPCLEPGCIKRFSTSTDLNIHKRTHTGEKPCPCLEPGCIKRFRTTGSLKSHMRKHTGERPFICIEPGCGRRFSQSGHLIRHKLLIHTKKRPDPGLEP